MSCTNLVYLIIRNLLIHELNQSSLFDRTQSARTVIVRDLGLFDRTESARTVIVCDPGLFDCTESARTVIVRDPGLFDRTESARTVIVRDLGLFGRTVICSYRSLSNLVLFDRTESARTVICSYAICSLYRVLYCLDHSLAFVHGA